VKIKNDNTNYYIRLINMVTKVNFRAFLHDINPKFNWKPVCCI